MKKKIAYIIVSAALVAMWSCKMELDPYDQTQNRVTFVFPEDVDSTTRFTFAYYSEDVTQMTVPVDITAIGYLSSLDRKVSIRQVTTTDELEPAVARTHYVPFDDPSVAESYVIKGDTTGARIPIILKRDPSLASREYILEISLVANEYFELGPPNEAVKRIMISDILTKPNTWKGASNWYLGNYGTEKHKVMIEAAAPYGEIINDEWIGSVMEGGGEFAYIVYWIGIFQAKLQQINDERAANGEGPLREGPEYGNVIVSF